MQSKLTLLKKKLSGYEKVAIAFSGGVDSTFLLLCAKEVLGESALAVTVNGPIFAPDEITEAKGFCEEREIPQLIINMEDEILQNFSHNPPDKCYICKTQIFTHIKDTLEGMTILDGTNADDALDYRPGRKALKELGIVSPLEEVGFTKKEIRLALKAMNIDLWDKPAYACLASRVPVGNPITKEKLKSIYSLEKTIRELGFKQVRVRHHDNIARIEILPEDFLEFCKPETMDKVNSMAKATGFRYATLDLGGYVMGNMNPPK